MLARAPASSRARKPWDIDDQPLRSDPGRQPIPRPPPSIPAPSPAAPVVARRSCPARRPCPGSPRRAARTRRGYSKLGRSASSPRSSRSSCSRAASPWAMRASWRARIHAARRRRPGVSDSSNARADLARRGRRSRTTTSTPRTSTTGTSRTGRSGPHRGGRRRGPHVVPDRGRGEGRRPVAVGHVRRHRRPARHRREQRRR